MNDTNECRKEVIESIEGAYKKGELTDRDIESIKEKTENVEICSLENKKFNVSFNNGNWQKYYYDPQTEKSFTRRSNKSAVTRIIISNYDNEKIKELKVLYRKQGGVDTIYFKNKDVKFDETTGKIVFLSAEANPNAVNPIEITCSNGIIEFEKRDKYTDEITRKFKIWGEFARAKDYTIVKVHLEDELEKCNTEKRKITACTERKLIPLEQIKNYAFLLNKKESEIDSLTIYKTKRFMTYRSNMEFYYNFIDKFFTYNNVIIDTLYKFKNLKGNNRKCCIDSFAKKIIDNIQDYIKNDENYISNLQDKYPEDEEIRKLEPLKYSDNEIKEDVPKIVDVFTEIRHGLMHFNYNLFEELFTGVNDSLTENLNLNIFKKLSAIKKVKEESRNTYLEDDDKLRIFNNNVKAKDVHNFYYKLCDRVNGLNDFINSFFKIDGVENAEFKKVINQDFETSIEGIKTYLDGLSEEKKKHNKLQNRYDDLLYAKEKIGEAYAWDIHLCPEYKKLYNRHKNLVGLQEFLISKPRNSRSKKDITNNNKEILNIKKQMEKITKINAKIRLEYKMRLFFGFLYEVFNNDIKQFKKDFDLTKLDTIKGYLSNGKKYLHVYGENNETDDINLKDIMDKYKESLEDDINLFDRTKENNLFKLYILFYLLLPVELRGDFLGYAKEHYYGIKNVDYISDEVDDKMKFFHKLRLFEKNIKKFEIISYSLSDDGVFKERVQTITKLIEKEANKQNKYFEGSYKDKDGTVLIFDKNIVAPILKLYEKLYNLHTMIEIHALTGIGMSKGQTIDKVIEDATPGDYYNYSKLINNWRNCTGLTYDKTLFDSFKWPRNNIAHLDYENLFDEKLFELDDKQSSLGEIISNSVKFLYEYKLNSCAELGMNIVNDFYMTLDNFMFNIKKHSYDDITSEKKEVSKKKDDEFLKSLGLEKSTGSEILKVFKKMNDFEISKNNINKLDSLIKNIDVILPTEKDKTQHKGGKKETKTVEVLALEDWDKYKTNINGAVHSAGNRLLGIYKKRMGLVVKDYLIKVLTKNEKRLLNLYVVDKSNLSGDKIKPYLFFISKEQDSLQAIPVLSNQKCGYTLEIEENKNTDIKEKSTKKGYDTIAICDGHEVKQFNFASSYVHRINYIISKQDK